jgi:hypothetical protein
MEIAQLIHDMEFQSLSLSRCASDYAHLVGEHKTELSHVKYLHLTVVFGIYPGISFPNLEKLELYDGFSCQTQPVRPRGITNTALFALPECKSLTVHSVDVGMCSWVFARRSLKSIVFIECYIHHALVYHFQTLQKEGCIVQFIRCKLVVGTTGTGESMEDLDDWQRFLPATETTISQKY